MYAASASDGLTVTNAKDSQGLLPLVAGGVRVRTFIPGSTVFGLQVTGEFSDDTRNDPTADVQLHGCAPVAACGHHLRFYPLRTAAGVIPNAYLVAVDVGGQNNDFNDNVYVVTNMTPGT